MAIGRALFGLIKGLVVGGAFGYCLLKLGNPSGFLVYLCCGIVGAVVGLFCGRVPWQAETIWTPVLKMVFGLGMGMGMYAIGHRFMPGMSLTIQGLTEAVPLSSGAVLAPLVGGLYGLFVEVDDGGSSSTAALPAKSKSSKSAEKALPEADLS